MNKYLRQGCFVLAVLLTLVVAWYAFDYLRVPSKIHTIAKIVHLEDRREFSGRLKSLLKNNDTEIRARTALAIGRIGGPGSASLLFPFVMNDPSLDVRMSAVFGIGLTGEKDYADKLLDIAYDLPSSVGAGAVEAIGRLADSSMTEVGEQLVTFLSHPSPEVREATCYALYRAGVRSAGADVIRLLQDEKDESVRKAALFMLARTENKNAMDIYADFLGSTDPDSRSLAVQGLSFDDSNESLRYLTIALNDANNNIVGEVIKALSKRKARVVAPLLLKRLERETDEKLIIRLIEAFEKLHYSTAIDQALLIASRRGSDNIVSATVTYVTSIRKDRAVSYIDSLILFNGPQVRASCAKAFGIIDDEKVKNRLNGLFKDEDPIVRASAFKELVRIDSSDIDYYLQTGLNDVDWVVKALAINKVGELKKETYLPALHTILSEGIKVDAGVRQSIVEAVGNFIVDGKADSIVQEILLLGMEDSEVIVRSTAKKSWDKQKNMPPVPMLSIGQTRILKSEIRHALNRYTHNPYATIVTSKGDIEIELYLDIAPLTVLNFFELANTGFYDGLSFHRVIPNTVIQGGDPRGDGWGGPDYFIRCEYSRERFKRGTLGIATSGKDTGGSQFFITLSAQPEYDGRYTVFGQVLSGMDVVDQIVKGDIIETVYVLEGDR